MKKRLLALLLTACMLISILPVGVFATDEFESEGSLSSSRINPVYENTLPDEAKEEILAELDELAAQEPEDAGDEMEGYVSESQLVVALRSKMLSRTSSATLYFYTTKNPYLDSTVDDLILKACYHDGTADHGDYIFWNMGGWGWQTKWYDSGSYHYITLNVQFSWNTTASQESQVTSAVNSLIKSFNFTSKTPTAYKVKAIYEWLCNNVTYDYAHLNDSSYRTMYSAYGAIIKRTCVCQGYALLLYRLLLSVGIDCRIVTSYDHAWNIVKMGNYWYYADSTWDAGDTYSDWWYFLAGTNSFDNTHYSAHHVREDGRSYGGYDYRYGSSFDKAHPMAYSDYSMSACEIYNHSFKTTTTKTPTQYVNGSARTVCTRCGQGWTEELPCTGYNPFKDVTFPKYYYAPVVWAYNTGVTSGVSSTSFGPNQNCTRAQFVTFLWRVAGEPEPQAGNNPFTDVKKDYSYKAILWAYQNGITSGTSATKFSPNDKLTRGQVVTFLWRFNGKPGYSRASNFTDVPKDEYYYDAVMWAAETGITSGTSITRFSPNDSCVRGQVVTFLYRNFVA